MQYILKDTRKVSLKLICVNLDLITKTDTMTIYVHQKQYKIVITSMHNQFILKCALLSCLFEPHITCKNNHGKSILQFWCIRNFWVCIPSCCLFASINYRFFFQFIQINSVTHCTCIKKSIRTMMLDACLRLIQYMVAI